MANRKWEGKSSGPSTPKRVSLTQVSHFTTMYVVKWWHLFQMTLVSSARHHFTTYIVVKRDTCVNDTRFGVDGPFQWDAWNFFQMTFDATYTFQCIWGFKFFSVMDSSPPPHLDLYLVVDPPPIRKIFGPPIKIFQLMPSHRKITCPTMHCKYEVISPHRVAMKKRRLQQCHLSETSVFWWRSNLSLCGKSCMLTFKISNPKKWIPT